MEDFSISRSGTDEFDKDIKIYKEIKHLNTIEIGFSDGNQKDLSELRNITRLNLYPIYNCYLSSLSIAKPFENQLKYLSIVGMKEDMVFIPLPKLEELQFLRIGKVVNNFHYQNLKRLVVTVFDTDNFIDIISRHHKIENLSVFLEDGYNYDKCILGIQQQLKHLKKLTFFNKRNDNTYQNLIKIVIPTLEYLFISADTNDFAQLLYDNPKLREIYFYNYIFLSDNKLYKDIDPLRMKTINIRDGNTKFDEKVKTFIDFILQCKNLEDCTLHNLSSNNVKKILNNLDRLTKLKILTLQTDDEITLIKDDFIKMRNCVLLERIELLMDWMNEENDIFFLFDSIYYLKFVDFLYVGFISLS